MSRQPLTPETRARISAAKKGKAVPKKQRPSKYVGGVKHWRCGACHVFFPASGFYKNKRTTLGFSSQCRKCHTAASLKSRDKEKAWERNAKWMRKARAENPGKFRTREAIASSKRGNTTKTKARQKLHSAIRAGIVIRPGSCSLCHQPCRTHGHHADYAQPLSVVWLCSKCHGKTHRLQP